MTYNTIAIALIAVFISYVAAHSMMSEPKNTSPNVCRLGGNPNPGRCPGPCDLTAIEGRWSPFDSPDKIAATYRRGQRVRIKYQRNNHGPGGFVRHTLVPVNQMMNKAAHSRNAFSYHCFGATPVVADASEKKVDEWGYSMVGNDGAKVRTGYYVSTVTIPNVIPDGRYVLGWIWYGGTGGPVSNEPYPADREAWRKAYFGDYWSCSFVEISGGDPLGSSYTPVFVNDLSKFSDEGCMSGNDAPGVCIREPCLKEASYMKPRPFKDGRVPDALTPANFGGSDPGPEPREEVVDPAPDIPDTPESASPSPDVVATPLPSPSPPEAIESPIPSADVGASSSSVDERAQGMANGRSGEVPLRDWEIFIRKRACHCLISGYSCGGRRARRTGGSCLKRTAAEDQPTLCKESCCEFCRLTYLSIQGERQRRSLCNKATVRSICRL